MLLFSTLLNIRPGLTKDDFIRLAISWNQGSPHKENVIPNIVWNGERNIRWGDDRLWMAVEEYRNKNIVAIRYEKNKQGVIWDSDYVLNFNTMKLSIRLDRSYDESALDFDPRFSTPYFITTLISNGWLVPDGQLEISREPKIVTLESVDLLAGIINRNVKYRLPVVFVSRRPNGNHPVCLTRLADRLKGIAHVLAEGDAELSNALQSLCGGHNEYQGAVGVYYPGTATPGNGGHVRHLDRSYSGWETELENELVREISTYANAQRVDSLYTWMGVRNALLLDRFVSQKQKRVAAESARDMAAIEAEELLSSVDNEIEDLKRQISALGRENESLRYENQGLRSRLQASQGVPVLFYGHEQGFFKDEIKDFVLLALEDARKNALPQSRKSDVLRDVIEANGGAKSAHARMRDKEDMLKRLFKGYRTLTSPIRQELQRLGFTITDDGKHYKLTYHDDGRYWTAIAKTSSDVRAGNNDSTRLIRMIL